MDTRVKPTAVWHGLCLSCRLQHGGVSTNIAAPLRRTGCMGSGVKSGLLWLRGGGGVEEFGDSAPVDQGGAGQGGGRARAGDAPVVLVVARQRSRRGTRPPGLRR